MAVWGNAALIFVWLCFIAGAWLDTFRPTGSSRSVKIAIAVLATAVFGYALWMSASTLLRLHPNSSRPLTTQQGLMTIGTVLIGLASLIFQWIRFVRARRDAGTTPAMHH